jgi:uncharacterized membrane protein YgaE (UPF0421/DUF939 family)
VSLEFAELLDIKVKRVQMELLVQLVRLEQKVLQVLKEIASQVQPVQQVHRDLLEFVEQPDRKETASQDHKVILDHRDILEQKVLPGHKARLENMAQQDRLDLAVILESQDQA